jgi:hypothetical protein
MFETNQPASRRDERQLWLAKNKSRSPAISLRGRQTNRPKFSWIRNPAPSVLRCGKSFRSFVMEKSNVTPVGDYAATVKETHTKLKSNALNFWEVLAQAIALISPSMTPARRDGSATCSARSCCCSSR